MDKIIPKHIGIILDGNRRWAKKRGLTTLQGHKKGFDILKDVATYAFDIGVNTLTVYGFSTENWNRSKEEVAYLMDLFKLLVKKEVNTLSKRNIRLKIMGDISAFDDELRQGIIDAEEKTKDNTKGLLNVCLNYGGRLEILNAVKNIIKDKIGPDELNEKSFRKYLYSGDTPDPELIIRTSGEKRLSGFLTWQSVYSELYFPNTTWPDFDASELDKAIDEFNKRQRRFGGN
ncbi:di-trans,poly-cis-decaprenylcistransferase [Candidatus Parcubacteria bacterium]|jgi:undecaprenyl diphosphate synthase|nr:di-trans,poly-cis-decaprenylcistransferase [Candidatus Parcubacteria bacterium]